MKKLRAADSADAIVDGLCRRRADVHVPVVAAPAQRPRPRAAAPHQAHRPAHIPQRPDHPRVRPAARADHHQATRRPLHELAAEALTNDETAERRIISLATQPPTSAASFSHSTHAAAPGSPSSPTRADSSSREPQHTDNEHAAPNRSESKRPGRASTRRSKWTTSSVSPASGYGSLAPGEEAAPCLARETRVCRPLRRRRDQRRRVSLGQNAAYAWAGGPRLRSALVPLTAIVVHVTRPGGRAEELLAAVAKQLDRGTQIPDERGHVRILLEECEGAAWQRVNDALDAAGDDWPEYLHVNPRSG